MRIVLVLLAGAVCFAQGDEKKDEDVKLPTAAEDIARGKALYMGSCTYCHGPQGDGGKGANLAVAELSRAKNDGQLARVIENGIPGTEMPGAWHMTRNEVTQVAAFVKTLAKVDVKAVPGDVAKGKATFGKLGCAGCHTVTEGRRITGGYHGPDLSAIGLRRSAAHLRESILDPAASVPEWYVFAVATTKDGKKISGRILNEDTFTVLMRDTAGNNHALAKSAVREVKKDRTKSTMPSYRGKLSDTELQDLVAYLVTLRTAS